MDIVLVPGFWLTADSWAPVLPALQRTGHTVHPLTLPGKRPGEHEADSATRIGLADHIEATIAVVDSLPHPLTLVGHSGGGAIIHGVVDARPHAVSRAVYVDSGPLADGACINPDLPATGGWIPFPGWEAFEDADLRDMTPPARAAFDALAVPEPAGVAQDAMRLTNPARYDVPVTVICCEFPASMMRELMTAAHPYAAELARCRDVTLLDLPTGHWPQLTRPTDLEAMLVEVIGT